MGKYTLEMILRPLGARTGGGNVIGFSETIAANDGGGTVDDDDNNPAPSSPAVCGTTAP